MSEKTNYFSNAPVSVEAVIGVTFNFIIEGWESTKPVSSIDPELLARYMAILEAVDLLTNRPELDKLRNAIAIHDEHALGALTQLADCLNSVCETLLERCKKWKREGKWTTLLHEAALATRLSVAVGQTGKHAFAQFLLANAYRALGDSHGAIEAYKATIQEASLAPNEHLLAVSYDNLGNIFQDVGRFDDALDCYKKAILYEHEPSGICAIHMNHANALAEIGDLRAARYETRNVIKQLQKIGNSDNVMAVALDNAALPIARLGEPLAALELLDKAREIFKSEDYAGRALNALNRSFVYCTLDNKKAACEAFIEAHDLAFEDARHRIDPEHYRKGFHSAYEAKLPFNHDAYRLFSQGVSLKDTAKDANDWDLANNIFHQAIGKAREAGDHQLALRILANVSALLADELGQVDMALTVATMVRHEAAERGLALPEMMAVGTLGSLAASGADIREPVGSLGAFVKSKVLLDVHRQVVACTGLNTEDAMFETYDTGTCDLELAIQAEEHHAYQLAIRYYREAVDKARKVKAWNQLVNRLGGLSIVLNRNGDIQEADTVAKEITELLTTGGTLSNRGLLVAHRALGLHFADNDHTNAINHLKKACSILEDLSKHMEPGALRANIGYKYYDIYRTLSRLLRITGNCIASFEALQGQKGRMLIDALASTVKGTTLISSAPPKADEISNLLKRLRSDKPTYLVDMSVEGDGITAYIVGEGNLQTVHVPGNPNNLNVAEAGDVREREVNLISLCMENSLLRKLAEAVTVSLPKDCRLLLVPDQILCNLPLHIIPIKEKPFCEHFSIGYLPAAGALRFAPGQRLLVGRSLVAGDSRGDLPHAAVECREIAKALNTKPLLGSDCTRTAIEEALCAGEFDVVHLSLHGRGDVRRGGRASLLLADGSGGTEWVAFDELATFPWRSELVVFSGCSTAVAGPRQGRELAGISLAAAGRGAAAVIACLWPVGDEAAKVFMTAFYKEFVLSRASGPVDLRVVLDKARKTLCAKSAANSVTVIQRRDGRSLRPETMDSQTKIKIDPAIADALEWAPFILLGDPILGG